MSYALSYPAAEPRAPLTPSAPPDDSKMRANVVADSSALELTLRALRPILARSDVTELCINRPGEAFIETQRGWQYEQLPFADLDWCRRLAKLVANSTAQRVDEESPLLSASLPSGERIQFVLPPATTPGTVAITIRRPSDGVWSVRELAERGLFKRCVPASGELDETEQTLLQLHQAREFEEFLRVAVRARKNIVVSRNPADRHCRTASSLSSRAAVRTKCSITTGSALSAANGARSASRQSRSTRRSVSGMAEVSRADALVDATRSA